MAINVQELISMNESLRESNLLLQGKCEALLEDLSIKEARWTEREERLNAEVRGYCTCKKHVYGGGAHAFPCKIIFV